MSTTEHHHHPAHLPPHERHHRTVSETLEGRDSVDGADSVSSSRSSSSSEEQPTAQTTTEDTSHAAHDGSTKPTSTRSPYRITVNCRSSDPIADSHTVDPEDLPSHWVPTALSQVTRATSTAFGQLTSPRQSTSSRPNNNEQQQKQEEERQSQEKESHILDRLTFQNPWSESFRKPGIKGLLGGGLKWGLPDSYIEGSGRGSKRASGFKSDSKIHRERDEAQWEDAELGNDWDQVEVVQPDWGWSKGKSEKEVDGPRKEDSENRAKQDSGEKEADAGYDSQTQPTRDWQDPKNPDKPAARVTWLGHATTLLQLPPLSSRPSDDSTRPRSINILFDPIFSERCSPSQSAGPQRFTPAPCNVDDLPPIDFVVISHSHYDHLDYHTFRQLRHVRGDQIHAFVPLGVKDKLTGGGGFGWKSEQVSELDWWDHAQVSAGEGDAGEVKIWCTPAQHGSGRGAGDKDASLWASWVVEWKHDEQRFCSFFAGDTGLKYHHDNPHKRSKYPACPAFAEIAKRFQPFDLLLLPISVGSSLSYFRSWDPFPRAFSPFPRVSSTLTSSIHMDPYDAVECHGIFHKEKDDREKEAGRMVSLAVHYGTFVRNDEQTKGDVRQLRKACKMQRLKFRRVRDGMGLLEKDAAEEDVFLVADQGRTLWLPIQAAS
ncbi:N-acyl-phosphatidylethanolamine-hydrolyzing phospholipase D [Pseudozyma hubeiensis SY62]|uniref:N-acyl-phosphatidylethanolamine-hydrolyzing phospholipase D n=1 Tax=Pseudozyma hubeiensis (strain SY62) TaxID=1305764 RepID=R9PBY3_PSEHS|nr:N-acyl-phosphatidylethanolamine-hydrolyzing phospholipase D [Pseudozyma hubeiensis SY62]GAC98871.1 N-acyl-phosphatidylethanolamine-hydrolyzing phospholipase D [Pseudozyma hubeiensis SY62]